MNTPNIGDKAVINGKPYIYCRKTTNQSEWMRDYTTAELRAMAYEKDAQRDYGAAAILWHLAAIKYPFDGGELAQREKHMLCERGNASARAAYERAHDDYRGDQSVMVLHPLTGATVLISLESWSCPCGPNI